ncbi:MAG: 30S ribosomal protein S7 [Thermodesulfobacteriota bacterium]|nr:30S ribosomal protein S7 [Thermodesulfobacteriota bacterium]
MPRRRVAKKREIFPDPKYNEILVTKFINRMMKAGKKSLAERILYESFGLIGERAKSDPLEVFRKAVENVKPVIEVKSRRVGGATYQVPMEVRGDRRISLAIRWIILNAKNREGKSFKEKLVAELLDAANNRGASIKKREDVHKMAEANKAFSHYRW